MMLYWWHLSLYTVPLKLYYISICDKNCINVYSLFLFNMLCILFIFTFRYLKLWICCDIHRTYLRLRKKEPIVLGCLYDIVTCIHKYSYVQHYDFYTFSYHYWNPHIWGVGEKKIEHFAFIPWISVIVTKIIVLY